jgi:anaerobic selenocysteine-containing dehydrogenase
LKRKPKGISRRHFFKTAAALALAAGTGIGGALPATARPTRKNLKIIQWEHTDPDFKWWFWNYCNDWGSRNDVQVDMRQASE